jgi:sodium-dependent dicarboxylate transporter 2/3/5
MLHFAPPQASRFDAGRRQARSSARMSNRLRVLTLLLSAAAFALAAAAPWHPEPRVRCATGVVLAALVLWISEIAPLGVIALGIPPALTLSGVLTWKAALTSWGDPIIFLFLGAFLLARALDKHGVFDRLHGASWSRASGPALLPLLVLSISGALSVLQNNTAVTAMLLPVVVTLARRTPAPALALLALSYGATFGGMATPVGTAPNLIGYVAMKRLDPGVNFLSWMRVGLPVWIGTTLIAWMLLVLLPRLAAGRLTRNARREPSWVDRLLRTDAPVSDETPSAAWVSRTGPARPGHSADLLSTAGDGPTSTAGRADPESRRAAQRWAVGAFLATAAVWLASGAVLSSTQEGDALNTWVRTYLPESLIPVTASLVLFMVRPGRAERTVLDRSDFQALDWDTLFLIAGGLCLGTALEESGAATALAEAVARVALGPTAILFLLAGVTVLLSEMTSNTATAALLVPLAGPLAGAVGLDPVQCIWLVALAASLGFALPVSTPPNAIVYGTRLVPLRLMIVLGLAVDLSCVSWVVCCVRWLA